MDVDVPTPPEVPVEHTRKASPLTDIENTTDCLLGQLLDIHQQDK
jgi:hypothetical protein